MTLAPDDVHYPDSDNKPMAENDVIRILTECVDEALRAHFARDPEVYVSSNLFLYYQEGDPRKRVAPDLFFTRGVPAGQRHNYKLWEEKVVPQVVFEFTTRSSKDDDLRKKKDLYEKLGVEEYYVFDPADEYLRPRFRAFRLHGGRYVEQAVGGGIDSPALGLRLVPEGQFLRFYQPGDTEPLAMSHELREKLLELEKERERAERLARKFRELGVDPDSLEP